MTCADFRVDATAAVAVGKVGGTDHPLWVELPVDMGPELKHLRYFVAVAEDLSFSRAARRLYVSQQALSRIIQQLEHQLGVKLFERTTRSVRLTSAGQAMLGPARQSIAAAEDALKTAQRAGSGGYQRSLRVDISSSGLQTGAVLLRHFRQLHPQIPVLQIEEGVTRGLVALQEGRLDVLLGLATHCPIEIAAEVIRRETVVLGTAADHPLADLEVVPVARLADFELLLPTEEAAVEWVEFVAQFCRQAGIRVRRWPGVTYGSHGAADVLRERLCVTPTTRWHEPPADLVFRPLVEPVPVFSWAMMIAPAVENTPQVKAFVECARLVAKQYDWLLPRQDDMFREADATS
ncbi:LysR family transcriptional regulator [Microbispora catharanthi]|uniref:LysR family transcriptional regulator n=1 Tax=Microbispora catharanthi TaxID=1712871 RepID=A0A5N6C153_9ACTN|nr:LysR family transcriptional regulator [Microbispora catharanthi]KAB8186485.1 LysR family transcriptional regulator [Microbispora catharanthi]